MPTSPASKQTVLVEMVVTEGRMRSGGGRNSRILAGRVSKREKLNAAAQSVSQSGFGGVRPTCERAHVAGGRVTCRSVPARSSSSSPQAGPARDESMTSLASQRLGLTDISSFFVLAEYIAHLNILNDSIVCAN